jgi:methylenetetrahydrofolate reductase (NADPH)
MKISEMFKSKKAVFSFEVFPPKKEYSVGTIYRTLDELACLKPDFISVTYGAGGTAANAKTSDIAYAVKNKYGIEALAHLTCINANRETVDEALKLLKERGIENVLALRGDRAEGVIPPGDFSYASDLITYINENYTFDIAAACYPEGHPEAPDVEIDILHLANKVNRGASHLVSQLFYDNNDFYNFMYRLRDRGITVPVQAGIMPVTNKKSISKMATLCGATFPKKFVKIMNRYESNPQALFDAGIAYATEQIIDLITNNVDGIHLYTMNNPEVAKRINANVRSIINSVNA